MGLLDSDVFVALEPARMPSDLAELDRATMLLGHLSKQGKVKQKLLEELEQLLGERPHPDVATEWKTALKRHRKKIRESKAVVLCAQARK